MYSVDVPSAFTLYDCMSQFFKLEYNAYRHHSHPLCQNHYEFYAPQIVEISSQVEPSRAQNVYYPDQHCSYTNFPGQVNWVTPAVIGAVALLNIPDPVC